MKRNLLSDIIINFNKIKNKNKDRFKLEVNKLWIHGLVHLFGYEHKNKDFIKMEKLEKNSLIFKLDGWKVFK